MVGRGPVLDAAGRESDSLPSVELAWDAFRAGHDALGAASPETLLNDLRSCGAPTIQGVMDGAVTYLRLMQQTEPMMQEIRTRSTTCARRIWGCWTSGMPITGPAWSTPGAKGVTRRCAPSRRRADSPASPEPARRPHRRQRGRMSSLFAKLTRCRGSGPCGAVAAVDMNKYMPTMTASPRALWIAFCEKSSSGIAHLPAPPRARRSTGDQPL